MRTPVACLPHRARRRDRFRGLLLTVFCAVWSHACGGPIGPAQPTLPLESLEISGVPSSGTVGDRFPLKVTATYVHGETEDVTSRVKWASTDEATAAVEGGELALVGAGTCEIRATVEQISISAPVSVERRPPGRSTLSGFVRNTATGKGVAIATVQVVDGPNAGHSASTDESGFYSLPSLIQGSFMVRVTRGGYDPAESAVELSGDTHLDLNMRALPPPPFTGATFSVRVATSSNRCGVNLPSSGRLVLSGTARRLTIRVMQNLEEREYSGSLEDDGSFSGSSGLLGVTVESQPHGVSTIKGQMIDATVTGTEKIATHLCPGGLGTVTAQFSGSR